MHHLRKVKQTWLDRHPYRDTCSSFLDWTQKWHAAISPSVKSFVYQISDHHQLAVTPLTKLPWSDMGVTVNQDLKWSDHITDVVARVTKVLNLQRISVVAVE